MNISAVQTGTGASVTVTDREGVQTTVHIDVLNVVDDWSRIASAVRTGLGSALFPVGTEFYTTDSVTGNTLVWVVVRHNVRNGSGDSQKLLPADTSLDYAMVLKLKNVYSKANGDYQPVDFSARQAIFYCPNGLAAGDYYFDIGYSIRSVTAGTYRFTLASAVPAGGQIALDQGDGVALTSNTLSVYPSPGAVTPSQSGISVLSGSSGTYLGYVNEISTVESQSGVKLNCGKRVFCGSANYAQGALRQWLNSAGAGSYWEPKTGFDRPPSWDGSLSGFRRGLPAEFDLFVCPAAVPCSANAYFESASLDGTVYTLSGGYTLTDKYFVLSRPEYFGNYETIIAHDGTLLDYYDGAGQTGRVTRDVAGTARISVTRTPHASSTSGLRSVAASGDMSTWNGVDQVGVVPACLIG